MRRPVDKLLEDIIPAADVAREIVDRGRDRFESDLVTQFGAEAAVGRIDDAASKLPEEVRASMPGLPWKEIIGFRIVVDHAYHRLDYGRVWNTLSRDVPRLRAAIDRSQARPARRVTGWSQDGCAWRGARPSRRVHFGPRGCLRKLVVVMSVVLGWRRSVLASWPDLRCRSG